MNTIYIEVKLKDRRYICFVRNGNISSIHEKIPLQDYGTLRGKVITKLSGLWLKIAAILAEKGELNG